jgi:uncharacterized LabA/DUF88 family protein
MAAARPPAPAGPPERVYAYIDGANLFNSAKRRFGYKEPNCDIAKLVRTIVALKPNRINAATYYYIGVPRQDHDQQRHDWWAKKLATIGKLGVKVVRRNLKARDLKIELSGVVHHKSSNLKLIEKGIDLRLGLDLVKHTTAQLFDVAMIFSQDGDLAEAVQDAYEIAAQQKRRIVVECCYPVDGISPQYGINKAVAVEFDRILYDSCIDPTDYSAP